MWIDKNQLGRRNLTPDQIALVSGRLYERKKLTHKQASEIAHSARYENNTTQNNGRTREKLASELGISPDVIQKNAQFVRAIETLKPIADIEANIQEKKKIVKEHVIAAAKAMKEGDEEKAKEILEHGTKPVQQGAGCMNSGS